MTTLAIDDNFLIAQQIRDMLKGIDPKGMHEATQDQTDALTTVERIRPDIVWLDIEMPGMNGLEMAAEIKKISPETNIVFVTGYPEYAVDAFGLHVSGFALKPVTEMQLKDEIENIRRPLEKADKKLIRVQCFGNFEVFHNGEPMRFSRSLSKEAMAYLVDRRGANCTAAEICAVLWEDRNIKKNMKSQCRVVMSSLKKDLSEIGAEDVLVKMWNTWSVNTEKISCDYYDFLRNDVSAINAFRGEYMAQYSWAEMTVGRLFNITGEEAFK